MGAAPAEKQAPALEAVALFIAKDDQFNRAILKYLWQNGVEAMLTHDLAEAQKMVIQHLPDFVFVPYDHPKYTEVAAFARKFGRLKSTQFIAYAEMEIANAVARISHFPTKRAIHPPVTGESFLKHIKAVLAHLPDYAILRQQKQSLINNMKSQVTFDPSTLGHAIQRALAKVSKPDLNTTPERIGITTRVCCATFDADFYKGYLVGVQGGDMESEFQFFEQFRDSFGEFLREKGIQLPNLKFKQIRVRKTPFSDWAQSKASIFKMSFHENRETALAFFEAPSSVVSPLGKVEKNMAPLAIKDIEINSPLPVHLYLYSATAFKYNIYLKRGRAFKKTDLEKLQSMGVTNLYVHQDDIKPFREFMLQNFLEDSVEAFSAEVSARELAERTRMSGELEMAKVVQDALFPKNTYEDEFIKIKGHYRTSSECGGDWWYYNITETKAYFWIGDATGHGVPAALVVSAARASSSLLRHFPDLSISNLMSILNHAIYGASNGKILMTFFLASLDLNTGELCFCNASHEPPMVFPVKTNLKKKDIVPLMGHTGPRLGEDLNTVYKEESLTIQLRDRIFFYTDGIPELVNKTGEQWSEQEMVRSLLKSFQKGPGVEAAVTDLESNVETFRKGTPLADDITYFFMEFKKKLT
ncbi:MAG: serine/threonine-protein phosphatase [Bdellovibrionaceae bacterium]|nr:serine/threonine-protein phosphatase [Bdellovibrionales bacterium]MCB9083440.1 serine/threonine-protein phosphatase [Pseudobdellovibrionaceae bacterium]